MNKPKDLRDKFQLAPQPSCVTKISGLVNGRANASMDEIAKIIASDDPDHSVTKRLIQLAYPRPNARVGATVQMATSRLGVNKVIVVMVGDLLTQSVLETFETMLSMTLETDASAISLDEGFLIGTVKFTGETNGKVSLAFSPHFSMVLAAQLLETNAGDELSSEAINDVIGEIVNIVTGNLQSRLSDAGMPSEVALPEVRFQSSLSKEGVVDQFYFRHGLHTLIVQLTIDPSASKSHQAPSTKGNSWRANGI